MSLRLHLPMLLALCSSAAIAQPSGNPAQPCYDALSGDARFAPIRDKVSLGGDTDEMHRMTARVERPGAQEIPAIATWKSARDACHRLETDYYAKRDEGIATLAREHFAALQALIGELQSGTMTYGDFGRRRLDLYRKTVDRIEQIRRSVLPPRLTPHPIGK